MQMEISYILDNVDQYRQMMKDRFLDPVIIDNIVSLHAEYTDNLIQLEKASQLKNMASKLVSKPTPGDKVEFDFTDGENFVPVELVKQDLSVYSKQSLIAISKKAGLFQDDNKKKTELVLAKRNELVLKLPNLLHSSVPIFESEDNNTIIKVHDSFDNTVELTFPLLHQFDLCCKLGIFESASDIAGHRGYFLVNEGVRLNYALINYALDFLEQRGYKLMDAPHFMREDKIKQVCQLSEFQETLYKIDDSDLYLIATSEQPLTAYFSDKLLNDLPVRVCGVSSCYRKEAGKHGQDTLGMFRVHQFQKVEQFCVTAPEDSWNMMNEMIKTSQDFFESLGLSYRVVNIVSKELNNAAAMKYDIEGLFRGTGKYRELVSCSNTTDYFSRRIRTKTNKYEFAHLLNSTLCANTRTLCCILETHQTSDGVVVPEVLRKYYGKDKIMFKN